MNANRNSWVPKVDAGLCQALEGKRWSLRHSTIRFGTRVKKGKIYVVPYPSGVEAYAYKVTDEQTSEQSFIKLYKTELSPKRFRRLEWLISQMLPSWDDAFLGAPRRWVSTDVFGYPEGINQELAGVMLSAVPGSEWKKWKRELEYERTELAETTRIALAKQLVRSLAILETVGLTHGDISDGNVMVHVDESTAQLYLIDFDGFVFRPKERSGLLRSWTIQILRKVLGAPDLFTDAMPSLARKDCRLTVEENGTIGTENYAPPELIQRFHENRHKDLAPDTDWHARDVLLVELLCWGRASCSDECPLEWDESQRKDAASILQATGLPLQHLIRNSQLRLDTKRRPTTAELAEQWSLDLPPERELVAVDPLVGRGGSKGDESASTTRKRFEKVLAYSVFLIALFFFYNRFFSANHPAEPSRQANDSTAVAESSPENQPATPTQSEGMTEAADSGGSLPQEQTKTTDGVTHEPTTTTTISDVAPLQPTPPKRSKPAPALPYGRLEQPLILPGWTYKRTYKRSFLYNQNESHYYDSLTFTLPRTTNSIFYSIDVSENGDRLGMLRSDGYGSVFNIESNTKVEHLYGGGRPMWHHLDLSEDGEVSAYSRDKNQADSKPKSMIILAYAKSGKPSAVIESQTMNPRYFAVSRDGQVVAYADGSRSVTVVHVPARLEDTVKRNSYSAGYVRNWAEEYQRTLTLSSPPGEFSDSRVANPSMTSDGRLLVVGHFESQPHTVSITVINTASMTVVWEQKRKSTSDSIFSPKSKLSRDGKYLVTFRSDETRYECVDLVSQTSTFSPSISGVKFALYEPDDTGIPTVISFTSEFDEAGMTLAIWNPSEPSQVTKHPLSERVDDFAISTDGRVLAIVHKRNGTVSVYNAE